MPLWSDRLRASEDLGRSQGDFLDRTEHTGGGGGPIQVAAAIGELISGLETGGLPDESETLDDN